MGILDASELFGIANSVTSYDYRNQEEMVEAIKADPEFDLPIAMTDVEMWTNYTDDVLYELDKRVREFVKKTRYIKQTKGGYRTTVPMVFTWIFGRAPEARDSAVCRVLHELMTYYCTSYTGESRYRGKKVGRVYKFSKYSCREKRPYSLRLRLEENERANFRRNPDAGKDKRDVVRRANRKDG